MTTIKKCSIINTYYSRNRKRRGRITIGIGILIIALIFATVYDIREYRVPNRIIRFGLGTSLIYQISLKGPPGFACWSIGVILPFFLLFILYLFHVIGAGDIKLFSVVGGFLGYNKVIRIILLAFIIGAVLSTFQLARFHNFGYRLQYLANYFHTLLRERKMMPYYNSKEDGHKVVIPFTVAITVSVLIMSLMGKFVK